MSLMMICTNVHREREVCLWRFDGRSCTSLLQRVPVSLYTFIFLQNVIVTLHSAFLNLTHVKYHPTREREREREGGGLGVGASRKTLYRINSTCSFQGGNWTHETFRFTLHKTFTYCSIKNRLSTVVHFSHPFDALSSK